jgi:hypothetical protein
VCQLQLLSFEFGPTRICLLGIFFLKRRAFLAVTRRATRGLFDFVLLYELAPERELVRRRLPFHVEYLRPRSHEALRLAVALQTPFHVQGMFPPHQRHLIDSAVTRHAADAFFHVNAVIEIDETGKVVHARPFQRLAGAITFAHRLQYRAFGPDLRVAVHADFRRRNAGKRRLLDRGMTVAAIDAVVAHVVLVAKLQRLRPGDLSFRDVRRAIDRGQRGHDPGKNNDAAEDADPGERIRAGVKYLSHLFMNGLRVIFRRGSAGITVNLPIAATGSASIGPTASSAADTPRWNVRSPFCWLRQLRLGGAVIADLRRSSLT